MQSNSSGSQMTERQVEQRPQLFIAEVHDGAIDAAYSFRAWSYGINWRAVIIAICTAVIALMQADSTVLVASLTGLVILLIPHADRDVAHALIETVLIKAKVVKQPSNEALIKFAGSARSSERHP